VLKIYSLRYVYYRFSALVVYFGTQPICRCSCPLSNRALFFMSLFFAWWN